MAGHVEQAFRDFHEFLAGARAPALVGQSLATVVVQDPRAVAKAVADWAYGRPHHERFDALLTARNKVFDIFFYRIIRFRRIFDFFDRFEEALLSIVPEPDRPHLERLLTEAPWREIRPLGSFRDPLEYALEKRRRASVQREKFNDDLYRNTTHEILSADKRHTFDDTRTESLVSLYQSQLAGVFDDFVDLIKDPQQRREILLANTADKHAVYATKSRFDIANYVSHLLEFVIALINDDYFEHGIQVFGVVRQIHKDFGLESGGAPRQRFKSQGDLIDRQKLAEYSSDPTRSVLLRSFLPLFDQWTPQQLMQTIVTEPDRRIRRLAVSLLGAYGHEAYELVVAQLATYPPGESWYHARNMAYLLGRIVTGDEKLKHRAVGLLAAHLGVGGARQMNLQVVSALGFIGTAEAVNVLVAKLHEFSRTPSDQESADVANKIVSTLLGMSNERAVEAAGEYCLSRNLVAQYREEIARAALPASLREQLVARIRQEVRKLRITRSLLGNAPAARALLSAVGHSGYPEIDELCNDIVSSFPAKHPLAIESTRLLSTPPLRPAIAADRLLHAFLSRKDITQALCHALDAGTSGRVDMETRDGVACWIDLDKGRVVAAEVSDPDIESERALYWIALLEPREIAAVRFAPTAGTPGAGSIKTPTPDLLRDVAFQRAEVRQIVDGIISPESRFKRRDVHPIYTDFSRLPQAERYFAVWSAVAEESDLKSIRAATGLSKHDIFRILLFFHRRNMLSVDGGRRDAGAARVADALATIEVYVRRIEQRPLQFRFYHTAADGCAFLERHATDEVIAEAARALGAYLLDAYNAHRAFAETNIDVCRRTIELIDRYHRGANAVDRHALADYVAFTFGADSPVLSAEPLVTRSLLEQLENIEFTNDAFDPSRLDYDEEAVEALVTAIDQALAASGVSVEALAEGELPTPTEAKILLELFSDVAAAYTKPIKDFVRELLRARDMDEPVSSGWILVLESSVRLLSRVAATMHFGEVQAIFARLERAIAQQSQQPGREVPEWLRDLVLGEHDKLSELAPLAFALDLTEEQLAVKKSELLATFVLRQVEGVTDAIFDRLAAASLRTFEAFLDIVPDDIVVTVAVDPSLAENIFMKFYQYQDLYRHGADPAVFPKYAAMFEIGLTAMKESCVELEKIANEEQAGREADQSRKARLVAARQRSLASLLALLCVRGQYDRVEAIQLAPFEKRILMLDEYFAELSVEHRADATV